MMTTNIEWVRNLDGTKGETWNPVTGCKAVSPGCDRCYAARETATRLAHLPAYEGLAVRPDDGGPAEFTGEIRLHEDRLDKPLRWRKPRRVFVNSMSDLFHPDVPLEFIMKVWSVMANSPQHTFQVLTKRPQRMQRIVSAVAWSGGVNDEPWEAYVWPGVQDDGDGGYWEPHEADLDGGGEMPLRNVWLGASIESDLYAWRADHLRDTPAAVRFVSAEPLLGPLPSLDLTWIDWLIVGAESGPGARPMDNGWVRELRDMSRDTATAVFVKQLSSGGTRPIKDLDQFPKDLRVREYPAPEVVR